MRIKCEAKRLLECIYLTKIEARGGSHLIPKSGYMYLDASRNGAIARGYNDDAYVFCNLDADILQDGKASLPIMMSKRFLRGEKGKVSIFTDEKGDRINIVSLDGHSQISIGRPDGNPKEPTIRKSASPVFNLGSNFSEYLKRALVTVAPEKSRPVLHGVKMKFDREKLILASADGFRLLHIQTDRDTSFVAREWGDIIIPLEICQVIVKRFKGEVSISFSQDGCAKTVQFTAGGLGIVSGAIVGMFPDYSKIIWNDEPHWTFTVPTKEFLTALGQFEPASGIVRLYGEGSLLKIVMGNGDDKFETCISGTIKGTGNIAVNREYMTDFIRLFTEVTCEMKIPSDPLKMTGKPEGMTAVLMPMFVEW